MYTQIRWLLIDSAARMHARVMRLLVVVVAGILCGGCTRHVANVCCTTFEDCSAIGLDQVRGCDDGLVCVEHMCTQTAECLVDNDCGAAEPHCTAEGACVECIDSTQCPSAASHCSDAHTCVACLDSTQCPVGAPVCDANACRRCSVDSECQDGICETSDGTCPAETDIAYASPTGPAAAPCTKSAPCSINHAFDVVTPTRKYVKLAPGSYAASIVIANKQVILDGFGASVTTTASGAAFDVEAQGSLTLRGVSIVSTVNQAPVGCGATTSLLSLDQVVVDSSPFPAIFGTGCAVNISRSKISMHQDIPPLLATSSARVTIDRSLFDGGDSLVAAGIGTVLRMTNSVVSNTSRGFSTRAFTGTDDGAIFVSFSTIANSPITCPTVGDCVANGLCLSDTIVANFAPGAPINSVVPGNGCRVNFSALFPQSSLVNGANNAFMNPLLVDPANGDFHLKVGSPALDAGDPTATNATDFEGTPRPQNGRSDMGAFERKP